MPSKPTPDQRLDDMAQEIVQMTDAFCGVYLTSECGDLCQDLAIALKTDHPSLLDSGRAKSWAAAVVYTVARVNFLFDPYTDPHMSATDLCRKLGVSQSNASSKSSQIMRAMGGMSVDPNQYLSDRFPMDPLGAIAALLNGSCESEWVNRMRPQILGGVHELGGIVDTRDGYSHVVGGPSAPPESGSTRQETEFSGLWHITDIGDWDEDDLNTAGQAYIRIDPDGMGIFRFGLVVGDIDGKIVEHTDSTRFEFTWAGMDEDDPIFGSGWMQKQIDPTFQGEIRLHMGDDMCFVAEKQPSIQGNTPSTEASGPRKAPRSVYQIKVTLRSVKPPIWRRILVAADTPLDQLHGILQVAMGWMGGHLHQFIVRGAAYGTPDPEFDFDVRDERRLRLDHAITGSGAKIIYQYDFGDGWEHDVLLEKIVRPENDTLYPVCIKGRRACPIEDCGGPWGYKNLLEVLQDPSHPEHEEMLEWAGRQVDAEAFDMEETNLLLEDYMKLPAAQRRYPEY